jgi:NitT/TauT family transport system substrate-binding protein
MNRHDSFPADRSVSVETRAAKPWDRREFVKGMAALAGSAGLLGYDPRPAAAEPPPEITKIRLVHSPAICLAPQYLAEELLHLEGFSEVEYVKVGVEPAGQLMAEGQADMSMWDVPGTIPLLDAGKPIVMLAGIHAGCYELFGNDRIHSVRDLKGARIGVYAVAGGDYVLISSILAYIGMDPRKDVNWVVGSHFTDAMHFFIDGKVDAFMGFAPEPQELRAKKIGHVIVNTSQDRPWSQYFCCAVSANRGFIAKNPIATKRALRAFLKAADICAREPERVARYLVDKGYEPRYEIGLEVLKSLPYARWRQSNPEDTLRFHALRLYEVGMLKSTPQKLIAQGTDWRFLNELKKELKA